MTGTFVIGASTASVAGEEKDGTFAGPVAEKRKIVLSNPATRQLLPGLVRAGTYLGKADTTLRRLNGEYRQFVRRGSKLDFAPSTKHIQYRQGRIMVVAVAQYDGAQLEADLRRSGLDDVHRYNSHIAGMLPIDQIANAASLDSLRSISIAYPPVRNSGAVTSQGDIALRADIARVNHSVDGTGIMVGV
ncbi:MAG TPA: hypothetical protein VJ984_08905, partial [Xanthomonadales bacterium]|nr:hypothetical protein [Xanthomonadales bacterium]